MRTFITLILCAFTFVAFGQETEENLPRGLAPHEIELINSGLYQRPLPKSPSVAPEGPVRTMAEWEELQGVVLTWRSYYSILAQMVGALNDDTHVFIVCNDSTTVKSYLDNAGVSYDTNVSFHEIPSNSVWVRDYGPNSAYLDEVDELVFIDWIYNRPRPKDDSVPFYLSEDLNIPIYFTDTPPEDIVNTGGNFVPDGMGNAFASRLVLHENDATNQWGFSNHSEEDVDAIMKTFMGLDQYIKMDVLPYDLIHHIDMHMKLLDEETILVGEYPENVADGPQIEANIEYVLSNYKTPYGNDYHIIRVPMPPDFFDEFPNTGGDYRTYANALFANNTILLPVYEEKYDTTAIRIWEESMPGYNVVGIDCNSIIPASGALHCISKEVGISDPILINMPHVRENCEDLATEIRASIRHKDGIASATVYYKTNLADNYESLNMVMEGDELHWVANIPGFGLGTKVYYYVEAVSNSGKSVNRPIVAPEGYWKYEVNCSVGTKNLDPEMAAFKAVFPNPASSITCIALDITRVMDATIDLFNVHGQKMENIFSGKLEQGEQKYFLDAASYSSGSYFIQFTTAEGSIMKKLMIE